MTTGLIMSSVLAVLRIGIAVFLGLCLVLYLFQGRLIFYPQALPGGLRMATAQLSATRELEVAADDGTRLRGWLRHTVAPGEAHSRGLVIYFGGNAEEVSAQVFAAPRLAPWSVATFNYRGYGLSEGEPGQKALTADALAIYDQLAARNDIDAKRIVVLGRSLGAGVAVHVAGHRPVRAAILVSPFDSLRSIAQKQYPFLPVSLLLRHPFDSMALAMQISAPLLMLAGQRDHLIPASHSRRLYDAWSGPRHWELIAGADHNDIQSAERYWPAMREFLASLH